MRLRDLLRDARWRTHDEVLGINERNALIDAHNPRAAIRLVDDKVATKELLEEAGVAVPPTLLHVTRSADALDVDPDDLPEAWACKPNRGLGGNGIMLAVERDERDGWRTGSGRHLPLEDVRHHVRRIVDGEFSNHDHDSAFFEPLVRAHADHDRLAHKGLPDVRILCREGEPLLAMTRLPTARSDGKANLHQGAIGAAVSLESGTITSARDPRGPVEVHPDTGERIIGATLPMWDEVLRIAAGCGPATGLVYVGADIVLDEHRGPLVLEVNARPGLEIQNVHRRGLRPQFADLIPG